VKFAKAIHTWLDKIGFYKAVHWIFHHVVIASINFSFTNLKVIPLPPFSSPNRVILNLPYSFRHSS